jgi:Iron-containing redox enzyme
MTSTASIETLNYSELASIQEHVERAIDRLLASFPDPARLSAEQRRGIVARYSAVLEGNFIYWMTGAYLAVRSEEARAKILENLHEEVRDSHPNMLRKFAVAASAVPTEADSWAVYRDLTNVRLFIGRLSAVPIVLTMAFFEGFIQRFMPFLAELAQRQGSTEMEYTDVHGVCDVTHTQELFRSLEAEMAIHPVEPETDLFEGMDLLGALIETIVDAGPDDETELAVDTPSPGRVSLARR